MTYTEYHVLSDVDGHVFTALDENEASQVVAEFEDKYPGQTHWVEEAPQ